MSPDAWRALLTLPAERAGELRELAEDGLRLLEQSTPQRRQRLMSMHHLFAFVEAELLAGPRFHAAKRGSEHGWQCHCTPSLDGDARRQAPRSQTSGQPTRDCGDPSAPRGVEVDRTVMTAEPHQPPARPERATVRELIMELTQLQDKLRASDQGWTQGRAPLVVPEAMIVKELRSRRVPW